MYFCLPSCTHDFFAIYIIRQTDLLFAPDGESSLSRIQLLFWLILVSVATAYISLLSGEVISLSGGVFAFLGIVSGTTLAYEAIAHETLPASIQLTSLSESPTHRSVRWLDLISTGDQIKIEKAQLLSITFVIGLLLLFDVVRTSSIPNFPFGLIAVLGASNALFLATKALTVATERVRKDVHKDVQAAILGPGMTQYHGFARFVISVRSNQSGIQGILTFDTTSQNSDDWRPVWVLEGAKQPTVICRILVHCDDPSVLDVERDISVPTQGRKDVIVEFPPTMAVDKQFWVTILQANRTVQVLESKATVEG
jgi:hypothetical protein